jgi:hypothetical protein
MVREVLKMSCEISDVSHLLESEGIVRITHGTDSEHTNISGDCDRRRKLPRTLKNWHSTLSKETQFTQATSLRLVS